LLADDLPLAREGYKRILEPVQAIEVVGEAITPAEVVTKARELQPDVVLLDLKWGEDKHAGARVIPQIRRECPATRIVAKTVYAELVRYALDAGADMVLPTAFSKEELVSAITHICEVQAFPERATQEAQGYEERLRTIPAGQPQARLYEQQMAEILAFLLSPYLTDARAQRHTANGTQIRDLIFSNSGGHLLWDMVRQQHSAAQIVFELKNVDTLANEHVWQLSRYLKDPLGNLGLLVTRFAPSQAVCRQTIVTYQQEKKLILVLSDENIFAMLHSKAEGADPSDLLKKKYLDFVDAV
jgi:DNA-binding NarL/FixJ family response regulator